LVEAVYPRGMRFSIRKWLKNRRFCGKLPSSDVEHMKQFIEIGHPLRVSVHWYDRVPEPPRAENYEGEVIGWRKSQLLVRIPTYSVLRFWKKNGLEVGNSDHARRGFRIDMEELRGLNNQEVEIAMPTMVDTDA